MVVPSYWTLCVLQGNCLPDAHWNDPSKITRAVDIIDDGTKTGYGLFFEIFHSQHLYVLKWPIGKISHQVAIEI